MTPNDSKSYFSYLIKLVDEYNMLIIILLIKNLLMLIILLWLKKLRQILNLLSLKLMIESELLLLVVLKTNPWAYKIEDLNREKLVGSFYEKKLLLTTL